MRTGTEQHPGLAQSVARLLWEQDVGSSSLPSRTIPFRVSGREEADKHGETGVIVHREVATRP